MCVLRAELLQRFGNKQQFPEGQLIVVYVMRDYVLEPKAEAFFWD